MGRGGGGGEMSHLKALDFGCGIGRQSILMDEFGIEAHGIDIAKNALQEANALAKKLESNATFSLYNGKEIPYSNAFFDFCISYGVLDSLPFALAKELVKEIDRVTKTYFFLSLIGSESISSFASQKEGRDFNGEIEVQEAHEKGTIQSFFDRDKIYTLFESTNFVIKNLELITHTNLMTNVANTRYYIVAQKAHDETSKNPH